MVMPVMSASWKASVPIMLFGTLAVIATRGTESMCALQMPVTRFVAPGPLVPKHTPTVRCSWGFLSAAEARA